LRDRAPNCPINFPPNFESVKYMPPAQTYSRTVNLNPLISPFIPRQHQPVQVCHQVQVCQSYYPKNQIHPQQVSNAKHRKNLSSKQESGVLDIKKKNYKPEFQNKFILGHSMSMKDIWSTWEGFSRPVVSWPLL
jgi:hypothetical protein